MVSVEEAHELSPLAGLDGVLAGAFCPLAGHATPEGAVQGYASAARAHNVRIDTHTKVTALQPGAVVTETGSVETECVVCAAGPWSREVGAMDPGSSSGPTTSAPPRTSGSSAPSPS